VIFLCGLIGLGERRVLKPNPSLAERQGRREEEDQKQKNFTTELTENTEKNKSWKRQD